MSYLREKLVIIYSKFFKIKLFKRITKIIKSNKTNGHSRKFHLILKLCLVGNKISNNIQIPNLIEIKK